MAHKSFLFSPHSWYFFFEAFLLRDVSLNRDKMSYFAVLFYGADVVLLVIQLAVLTPVDKRAIPGLAVQNRVPQLTVKLRCVSTALQIACVFTEDFFLCIPGYSLKCAIYLFNRTFPVGNNYGII